MNPRLTTFALWFFAFSFTLFAIQSSDVYMYLSLARDFLLKWDWSSQDPYLYSLPGAQLVWAHEYLSYLVFYGVHAMGGIPGLMLFKAALLTVIFAIVLTATPRGTNRSLLWTGLWILAVIAASFRFIERSSLISDLFCVVLVKWLLDNHTLNRGFALRLSALFFLWIQFHPGFPLGLVLLSLWCAWGLIFNPLFLAKDLRWLLLPVGALFLNPLHWEGVLYPFQFALHEARTLKNFNFEWLPAYHRAFRFSPEVVAFWVLSVLSFFLIAREKAWVSLRSWFAAFAFVAAAGAVRFVPWAAFVMVLAVKPWSQFRLIKPRAWVQAAVLAALAVVGVKNLLWGYSSSSGFRKPGFALDGAFFPQATLEVLRRQPIPGRVYNTHEFGAWMIWQGVTPVFHHGFVTDMAFYREDVMGVFQSQQRFLELAAKHNWTMLLLEKHNSYSYFWKILSPLPNWKIVAEDEASYLIYNLP